jgi:NAD(P)-dependent dehydrogenase (short-subunit alcohol dehydrogenase family)
LLVAVDLLFLPLKCLSKDLQSVLQGKSVIITGAGSGIGRAAALLFAEAGAKLVVGDRSLANIEETAALVRAAGGDIIAQQADIIDESQVAGLVDLALHHFGQLDGAFNNAGVQMVNKLTQDLTIEDWNSVNGINATGIFLCMKYEIQAMRKSGGGAIVNTASANGMVAQPYSTEYVASKHAVIGITRGAASEALETGVRVNCVLPGMINTPMIADLIKSPEFRPHYDSALARHTIGRFGEPEDVAYVARFLLSDQSAFMNGASVAVDGGYTAR